MTLHYWSSCGFCGSTALFGLDDCKCATEEKVDAS